MRKILTSLLVIISIFCWMGLSSCAKTPYINKGKDMTIDSKYYTIYKSNTTEHFNEEDYTHYPKKKEYRRVYAMPDGTEVKFSIHNIVSHTNLENEYGTIVWIVPPPPAMYQIYKTYHGNGILRHQSVDISGIPIAIEQEFDIHGKLIKEINYEKKVYNQYHYDNILQWLDKKGYINLRTGEGREDFGSYSLFNFILTKDETGRDVWKVTIEPVSKTKYIQTDYILDAKTLEVLDRREEFKPRIE